MERDRASEARSRDAIRRFFARASPEERQRLARDLLPRDHGPVPPWLRGVSAVTALALALGVSWRVHDRLEAEPDLLRSLAALWVAALAATSPRRLGLVSARAVLFFCWLALLLAGLLLAR